MEKLFVLASVVILGVSSFLAMSFMVDLAEAHEGQLNECAWTHPKYACSNARPVYKCYSAGYIACHSSSSCDDGGTGTTDVCSNADTTSSLCSYSSCPSDTADVDDSAANGCEVNLLTDSDNCGSVGNVCSSGVCASGSCTDFTIAVDPTVGLANAGDSKLVNATLTLTAGTGSSVSFSATNLPTGASAAFSPTSCTPTCNADMTVSTTSSTPVGSHIMSVSGALGSVTKTATYNLTILPSSGIVSCGNAVCEYPETQSSCSADCTTTTSIPSPVSPGDAVSVEVEFYDYRYQEDGSVKIDIVINPEGTSWTPSNGCFFGGQKMAPSAGTGAIAWPGGTVSENGHFKISTVCTLPSSIAAGAHTLVATPVIF